MAMHCVMHSRECTGCMACYKEPGPMYCPNCEHPLDYGEQVYKQGGDVIGCEYCITAVLAEDELLVIEE